MFDLCVGPYRIPTFYSSRGAATEVDTDVNGKLLVRLTLNLGRTFTKDTGKTYIHDVQGKIPLIEKYTPYLLLVSKACIAMSFGDVARFVPLYNHVIPVVLCQRNDVSYIKKEEISKAEFEKAKDMALKAAEEILKKRIVGTPYGYVYQDLAEIGTPALYNPMMMEVKDNA